MGASRYQLGEYVRKALLGQIDPLSIRGDGLLARTLRMCLWPAEGTSFRPFTPQNGFIAIGLITDTPAVRDALSAFDHYADKLQQGTDFESVVVGLLRHVYWPIISGAHSIPEWNDRTIDAVITYQLDYLEKLHQTKHLVSTTMH